MPVWREGYRKHGSPMGLVETVNEAVKRRCTFCGRKIRPYEERVTVFGKALCLGCEAKVVGLSPEDPEYDYAVSVVKDLLAGVLHEPSALHDPGRQA